MLPGTTSLFGHSQSRGCPCFILYNLLHCWMSYTQTLSIFYMNDINEYQQVHKKNRRKHVLYLSLGCILLGGVFMLTAPSEVPLYFLLAPFLLIGFSLYHLFSLLLLRRFHYYKKRLTAGLLATVITILLLLSSLEQLSLLDVVIALLFSCIALIYVHYAQFF